MKRLTKLRAEQHELNEKARSMMAQLNASEDNPTEAQLSAIDAVASQLEQIAAAISHAEKLEALERSLPAASSRNGSAGGSPQDPGAEKFSTFGEQLSAVIRAGMHEGVDPRLSAISAAASGMSEGAPSDGGYLVQQDFASELLRRVYDTAPIASRVRRIGVSANANGLTMNAVDESSRASGSRWGGVRAYWADEAGTVTATQPKFRKMELKLHKLLGICYATDELLSDAGALEQVIGQAFTDEFSFIVDDAILNGDGAGKPLGIMASPSLVSVAKEGSQAAATVNAQNVAKMYGRMWARSIGNSVWLVNQDVLNQFWTMSISNQPVYLPPGGFSQAPFGTLMGRPIVPVEQAQTLGTLGDILLVDPSQYLLIDKGGINAASSVHVRFLYDEMTFRFTYRCDGQPVWNKALTPYKGSNSQSPFIALAERA